MKSSSSSPNLSYKLTSEKRFQGTLRRLSLLVFRPRCSISLICFSIFSSPAGFEQQGSLLSLVKFQRQRLKMTLRWNTFVGYSDHHQNFDLQFYQAEQLLSSSASTYLFFIHFPPAPSSHPKPPKKKQKKMFSPSSSPFPKPPPTNSNSSSSSQLLLILLPLRQLCPVLLILPMRLLEGRVVTSRRWRGP